MDEWAAEGDWEGLYSDLPVDDLEKEKARLVQSTYEVVKEYMEEQFAAGNYEVTNEMGSHGVGPGNPFEIRWVRFDPGQTGKRVVAPEARFENAYRMQARSVWIAELILRRRNTTAAK